MPRAAVSPVRQLDIDPPYLVVVPGMTEKDFYKLADEDSNWEYLDGRIVMHSPASDRHEDLFSFLMTLLRDYLGERGGAVVRGSRYPMRLDEHWSPEPNLLVVRDHRRALMTKTHLRGPADFVIEIVSESDPTLDYREKLPRYREARIDEIWIIDPFRKRVRADVRAGRGYSTKTLASGQLESAVIPGFWIDVRWLWRSELPPTLRCVRAMLGGSL
jgi:Uma2 family endonuclease